MKNKQYATENNIVQTHLGSIPSVSNSDVNSEAENTIFNGLGVKYSANCNLAINLTRTLCSKKTLNEYMMILLQYDYDTYIHSINVAILCGATGIALDFSKEDVKELIIAGLLHDIGKVLISEDVIKKPGKLTDTEFKMVKTHPELGFNILEDEKVSTKIKIAVLQHHEDYDGSGYPQSLLASHIHIFSRILRICDVYDALISKRCYKDALSQKEVISYMKCHTELIFDPNILKIFLRDVLIHKKDRK